MFGKCGRTVPLLEMSQTLKMQSHYYFQPNWSIPPTIEAQSQKIIESINPSTIQHTDNYCRWVEWSSTSKQIASLYNDKSIKIWNSATLLNGSYTPTKSKLNPEDHSGFDHDKLAIQSVYKMAESINDFAWYPALEPSILATCCPDQPIHLIDTDRGSLLHTYLVQNHLHQVVGPTALKINPYDPTQLVAGFKNGHILSLNISHSHKSFTPDPNHRRHKKKIISCIEFVQNLTAVSNYNYSIQMFDPLSNSYTHPTFEIKNMSSSVTYMTSNQTYLATSHRSNGMLTLYDLRYLSSTTSSPVWSIHRPKRTQMRTSIQFIGLDWLLYACAGEDGTEIHCCHVNDGLNQQCVIKQEDLVTQCHVFGNWACTSSGTRHLTPNSIRDHSVRLYQIHGEYCPVNADP